MFGFLETFADLVLSWLGLSLETHLGGALHFFIYDTLKIFLLLAVIIYAVAVIRSWFPPERTKRILSHKREYVGNGIAALLGVVTPFCSCSAVPLFIGFVESGVPLGVTFSFLISSPMVNEVALIMLWGMFGWQIALIYLGTGLLVAVVAGIVIGRLKMEKHVQDYVWQLQVGNAEIVEQSWPQRLVYARDYTTGLLKKIWPYVVIGIGIGALSRLRAPGLPGPLGRARQPLAVPLAVALGVPLYSNAAGVIPIVQALTAKGMAIGTVLAFMMAVTALSLPEAVLLSNVLKKPLLATFFGVVAVAIVLVGYLFNAIL
jgi:uncharacterized membrane protein YraQ (UPF0718 family)